MATIEARGYVNKPQSKTTKGGKAYSQFNLGVKQKDKKNGEDVVTWANFQVTDFKNSSPPAEKAFVTVSGYFKVREAVVNGEKRTFLEINAQELEVAPPLDGSGGGSAAPASQKPAAGDDDDFGF